MTSECPGAIQHLQHEPHKWGVDDVDCPGYLEGKEMDSKDIPHNHKFDGKWHIDCEVCSQEPIPWPYAKDRQPDAVRKSDVDAAAESRNFLHENFPETKPGQEVQRWADEAMFKAEPIDATTGPKIYLLWMTPDPLGAIAAACKMYKGEVVRDLFTVTDAERLEYFQQIQKTKLKAPFEFVKFHFLIEGVTRAFTHQMVRQRTAAYAQESLRFAVKEDMPVALPPSLAGSREFEEIQVDVDLGEFDRLSDLDRKRFKWERAVRHLQVQYDSLIEDGMPAEDARGLLPHNVLTRLHYTTDLRALLDHAGNRLCTQAQFEWRLVFAKIIEAIRLMDRKYTAPPGHIGEKEHWKFQAEGMTRAYMADTLTEAFKPVCFQTGKCEFKANFDRYCNIRERVDANEQIGRSSDRWHDGIRMPDGTEIHGIKPGEWLLDSGAARKRP
jgi:flavin-dependent thymidylate synthase